MAARAEALQPGAVEEVFFQSEAVSLCLLVNRRTRAMRVIDFRAGPSTAKRAFVESLARRESVDKAYTLVERDEVPTWLKLGFAKEGTIPGFYKRSDAFLLGCAIGNQETPMQSEMRLTVAKPVDAPGALPAGHERMEHTIAVAKRNLKDVAAKPLPLVKLAPLDEGAARRAASAAARTGRALTGFEAFGRDVTRRYFAATARGGFELVASAESQACFGNAYVDLLVGPRTDAETWATAGALDALCAKLCADDVVSCFSLAPSDDVPLALAFLSSGFRRTGLLAGHLMVAGRRKDAILWSRKLASPPDD